jgi:hypothetical protein
VAGLSLFDKSLSELYETYVRTRLAVQEAMPDASALIGLQEVICRINACLNVLNCSVLC